MMLPFASRPLRLAPTIALAFVVVALVSGCRDDRTPADDGATETGSLDDGVTETVTTTESTTTSADETGDTSEELIIALEGAAAKGPFLLGSSIDVATLTGQLNPSGELFKTQTVNDLGQFSLDLQASGIVSIEALGFYFNEVTGELSDAALTLRAYYEPTMSGVQSAYVNMVTHLAYGRIAKLVGQGSSYVEAVEQSETEVRAATGVGVSGFDPQAMPTEMNLLGGDNDANAYLFAVSAVLAQAAALRAGPHGPVDAHLQELLNTMSQTLSDLGQIAPSVHEELLVAQQSLDTAAVMANLQQRFDALGAAIEVPNIDRIIDTDLDGVPNTYDNCPWDFNPDQTDTNGNGVGDACECGNGIINVGQECDEGESNAPQSGCEPDCRLTCAISAHSSADELHNVAGVSGNTIYWNTWSYQTQTQTMHARAIDGEPQLIGPFSGSVVAAIGSTFILGNNATYVTDGTAEGTVQIGPPSGRYPVVFEDRLWFLGAGGLWVTDGTDVGTENVHSALPYQIVVFDDALLFRTQSGELWRSDGTTDGTVLLDTVEPELGHPMLLAASDGLILDSDLVPGQPIWVSSGDVGALEHVPIEMGTPSFRGTSLGSIAIMVGCDETTCTIVRSDGTPEGTDLVMPVEGEFDYPTVIASGGRAYFSTKGNLWGTDGTSDGTTQVVGPQLASVPVGATDAWLWFPGNDSDNVDSDAWELWRLDAASLNAYPVGVLDERFGPFIASGPEVGAPIATDWIVFNASSPSSSGSSVMRCKIPD